MRCLKGVYVKFKNCERKIKLSFLIYADFESILVAEINGKPNTNQCYANKYKKHVACKLN